MKAKSINAIFISEDINARIVFKNVFEKLDSKIVVHYFFDTDTLFRFMKRVPDYAPQFIFVNASNGKNSCFMEIEAIRQCANHNQSKIVMFDSYSVLKDTYGIFSMGVDVFLPKPYDFLPLKKALRDIIFPNDTSSVENFLSSETMEFQQYP